MKELIIGLGIIAAAIVFLTCVLCGMSIVNDYWNCSSYKEAQTKMIGGTCYVKTEKGKWILFHSYVSQLNVKEE